MLHASTRKLIDRLAEMTDLNKLDWTESDAGQITYSTEGYSVSLTEDPNEVVITSKDGKELERATAEELSATQTEDGKTYAQVVGAMTSEAARIARGTEAAISSLLAGMADPVVDPEPNAVEETEPEEMLAEDSIDDTHVAATAAMETTDMDAESDIAEAGDFTDQAPEESALEDDEADDHADEEVDADDAIAAVSTSEEPVLSDAETESDVTEAVARLADEVNQREESGLDAAAATAVGAVALAAGLAPEDEASKAEESAPSSEIASASEETPVDDAEPAKYVPFGLDAAAPAEPEEVAPIEAEATAAIEVAASVEETEPETVIADTEPVADEPFEPSTEVTSAVDAEPVSDETEDVAQTETVVPFAAVSPSLESEVTSEQSFETNTLEAAASAEDPAEMEVMAAVSEPITEIDSQMETVAEAAEEKVQSPTFGIAATAAEAPMEPMTTEEPAPAESLVDAVAQPADTGFVEPLESPTVETAPAESIAVETPVPITQQSYSLSGIGAGFGLGALSAKTEASGVPGPGASPEPEKVVIDATEDVLPDIDGKPALPEGSPISTDTVSGSDEGTAEASSDADESDILKPRTRFNPWD